MYTALFLTGIQLKDLIATNTALPDMVNGNLINVHKLITLSGILSKFFLVQRQPPPVSPNTELLNMLRVRNETDLFDYCIGRFTKSRV